MADLPEVTVTPADPAVPNRTLESYAADYKALEFVIKQLIGRIVTTVVVRVVGIDRVGSLSQCSRVSVQPLLKQKDGSNRGIAHGIIGNVPVFRIQAGSAALLIDPAIGDVGAMLVAYRDTSVLVAQDDNAPGDLQGAAATFAPMTNAQYDWGSGLYLGGLLNGEVAQYIQLTPSLCKIVAPLINLNGVTIDPSGNVATAGGVTAGMGGADAVGLQTHKHPTAATGSPSPPTPGT